MLLHNKLQKDYALNQSGYQLKLPLELETIIPNFAPCSKLYALKNAGNITFVHGIGKRKTPLQKSIETLEEALSKLKEYTQKIHICGERNSYSKTDIVT